MTTNKVEDTRLAIGVITLQKFVGREIIYCVSSLIYSLIQEKQYLDEELFIDLWTSSINYDDAEPAITDNNTVI